MNADQLSSEILIFFYLTVYNKYFSVIKRVVKLSLDFITQKFYF